MLFTLLHDYLVQIYKQNGSTFRLKYMSFSYLTFFHELQQLFESVSSYQRHPNSQL